MENENELYVPWPRWKIVDDLGAGAFGQVLEIERNLAGINEKAAMKVISRPTRQELEWDYDNGYDRRSITDKYTDMLQRCISEYKVMIEMKGQSNIVSCDDLAVERHSDGIGWDIYIRMELLTPLTKVMRNRMLTEAEVVKLGKDICQALILCESRNIIHRDIKPANIMLSKFGDFKLGDFGQAKILDHTTAGTQTGTPDFWAPEVKNFEKYGKEADIYSLGMVMYILLNNRKMPFINADEIPTYDKAAEASFRRYQGEKIPEPKYGNAALKRIILKACEFNPCNRYRSARDMYQDLEMLQTEKNKGTNSVSAGSSYNHQNKSMGNNINNWNAKTIPVNNDINNWNAKTMPVNNDINNWNAKTMPVNNDINNWNAKTMPVNNGANNQKAKTEPKNNNKKSQAKTGSAKAPTPKKEAGRVAAEVQKKPEKKKSGGKAVLVAAIAVIGIAGWAYSEGKLPPTMQNAVRNILDSKDNNTGSTVADTKIKTEDGTQVTYYDNGNIRSEQKKDSDGNNISYISYYENGNKEYEVIYSDDKMHETHTGYKEDGSVSYSYEVEYDSNGKALKQTDFSSDGTVDSISEFDENENIIKSTRYENEKVTNWTIYEYDSEGKKIAQRTYTSEGKISTEILFGSDEKPYQAYSYDENGNATEGKITFPEGVDYQVNW